VFCAWIFSKYALSLLAQVPLMRRGLYAFFALFKVFFHLAFGHVL
jgi:hypothetical protein